MLPLTELEVTRYRGLRDLSLRGLGRVNLLVGRNNSGKTSVLEAISLAANPLDPMTWRRVAIGREPSVLGPRRSYVERLRWLFPQHASEGPDTSSDGNIKLASAGRSPVRVVEARYQPLRGAIDALPPRPGTRDEGVTDGEPDFSSERRGTQIDVEVVLDPGSRAEESSRRARETFTWWEWANYVVTQPSPEGLITQVITPYDHWFRGLPTQMYSDMRAEGAGDDVIRLLSRVDPRIVGLEVLATRSGAAPHAAPGAELFLRDRSAGLLPVGAFGDGMRRILLMALGVTRARGGVLLIDEIETAIHVSVLGHVFRWIVEACAANDVQLFVTTHSLEAIDAILAADTTPEEDIVGYRLDPTETTVSAHRYGEDLLKRLRFERGADVR
ncbi:MAG TPA: AAA family ATPase [Kofleriaceae bacterium]|nr:AAA family ATPase [Kofleriaceae bacterium]